MASKEETKPTKVTKSGTPGPQPDRLKIDRNWKEAVKQSFEKKKPAEGWPK
jgi:hypothetical protein